MITVKHVNRLGILLALVLIFWGIAPFFISAPITNDVIASSIILVLVGIGYIVSVINPAWNKAILFIEGLIFALCGGILLSSPYDILFIIIGLFVLVVSVLAYLQRLPKFLLKFFYR
ncbi:MAG: hypothetical protein Q4P18_05230 [Methanobrevibacter sp.]|uniref:hypothetical protein n=1 Tax=Methanobrevibacter sp. TaxID=66852 RepID=UPI0026E0AA27|nr:hypothetical protein [Methanobrevibacter sp.]MDO5848915.1 hypothetical protein [Methanobrevibacter sp.]